MTEKIRWQGKAPNWSTVVVDVESLKPHSRNPRTITKEAFERLCQRIREEGFRSPITTDGTGRILAGHQRWRAAKELGIKQVPIMTPDRELTADECGQILVADNVSHGQWDFDILSADFEPFELASWGVELPELVVDDKNPADAGAECFKIVVETLNEADRADLVSELEARGYKCKT